MAGQDILKYAAIGLIGCFILMGIRRLTAPPDRVFVRSISPTEQKVHQVIVTNSEPRGLRRRRRPREITVTSSGPPVDVYIVDMSRVVDDIEARLNDKSTEFTRREEEFPPSVGLMFQAEQVTSTSCSVPWKWYVTNQYLVYVSADEPVDVEIRAQY